VRISCQHSTGTLSAARASAVDSNERGPLAVSCYQSNALSSCLGGEVVRSGSSSWWELSVTPQVSKASLDCTPPTHYRVNVSERPEKSPRLSRGLFAAAEERNFGPLRGCDANKGQEMASWPCYEDILPPRWQASVVSSPPPRSEQAGQIAASSCRGSGTRMRSFAFPILVEHPRFDRSNPTL